MNRFLFGFLYALLLFPSVISAERWNIQLLRIENRGELVYELVSRIGISSFDSERVAKNILYGSWSGSQLTGKRNFPLLGIEIEHASTRNEIAARIVATSGSVSSGTLRDADIISSYRINDSFRPAQITLNPLRFTDSIYRVDMSYPDINALSYSRLVTGDRSFDLVIRHFFRSAPAEKLEGMHALLGLCYAYTRYTAVDTQLFYTANPGYLPGTGMQWFNQNTMVPFGFGYRHRHKRWKLDGSFEWIIGQKYFIDRHPYRMGYLKVLVNGMGFRYAFSFDYRVTSNLSYGAAYRSGRFVIDSPASMALGRGESQNMSVLIPFFKLEHRDLSFWFSGQRDDQIEFRAGYHFGK